MALRRIGYWKESLSDEYPLPQELEAEYAPDVRDRLATHLESGAVFAQYRGYSFCRYGCGLNGSAELTDGVWVWPAGLAHYVRHHAVGLPPDFVRDATRGNALASATRPPQDERADDSYWIGWARARRTPATETLLAEAREAAARACEAALDAAAAEWTERFGVEDRACLSAGCDRRAVTDKALCGRCFAERDRDDRALAAERRELSRVLRILSGCPAVADPKPASAPAAGRDAAVRNGPRPWWKPW